VADLPFSFTNPAIATQLRRVVDREEKIPRAIAEIGEIAGRDVVVLHVDGGIRPAQLRALGARVTASEGDGRELRPKCADVVVRYWGEAGAVAVPPPGAIAAAERLLRPQGRLLIVADYGRDDVARLRPEGETPEVYRALRARDAEFIEQGFKLRVIHGWWTFDSVEEATAFLGEAFGDRGLRVAAGMRRPRLSHKVVIYHRDEADRPAGREEPAAAAGDGRGRGRPRGGGVTGAGTGGVTGGGARGGTGGVALDFPGNATVRMLVHGRGAVSGQG
jgi:hypothetical protein